MKKPTFYIATALLMLFMIPTQLLAGTEDDQVTNATIETLDKDEVMETVDANEAIIAESEVLLVRLEEINEMDKTDMTRSEKRELRKEVRQIEKALEADGGGVYLSVGAIIVVLLLLILLL